jgi:hypothetical protein
MEPAIHAGGRLWGPALIRLRFSTWDDGDYFGTSNASAGSNFGNGPDDLQVITTKNGFSYRTDDHGDTQAAATSLRVDADTELSGFGIIERSTDIDYFEFETGAGDISLTISPFVQTSMFGRESMTPLATWLRNRTLTMY